MRLAIIGAGNVGGVLGRRWAESGHEIHFGVLNPAEPKYDDLRALKGVEFSAPQEAADRADVIVLTVPWGAAEKAIRELGPLGDRIIVDCTNPVTFGPEGVGMLSIQGPSGAELIARAAQGGRAVKTLNQVGFNIMANPAGAAAPALMFVAGDDANAKAIASDLVRDLGFDARDAGPLRNAAALEHLALLWIDQAFRGPHGRNFVLSVTPVQSA